MKIKDIVPEIEGKTIKLKFHNGWLMWFIHINGCAHSVYARNFKLKGGKK